MNTTSATKAEAYKNIKVQTACSLVGLIGRWKTDSRIELPSEWAEKNRYLPSGTTEYPGLVDWSIAPHLKEICDCAHPDSGVKYVTCMKSTQSLFTTTVESAEGWAIKHKRHNILNIISSKNIAKIRSSSAIDVMIDSSGLASFVRPMSERMKKKTGDNTFYKEFHGGRRMLMTSWNSIGDAKSVNWSFIFEDELDEAAYELKGQGDPQKIFEGRKKTVKFFMVYRGGTPINSTGRTYKNFLEGDQRYYNVPCPLCGEKQTLVLMFGAETAVTGNDYGLTARSENKNGVDVIIPESVEYVCKYCKKAFKEHHKGWMLSNGLWIPTAEPKDPEHRSYHISNMMSPVMFFTWKSFMQEFANCEYGANITAYKNFRIDNLGWPWENRAQRLQWREIKDVFARRGDNYPLGMVPDGGLILTAGVDVQKRWLEMVVIAWGANDEYWIIDHQKFNGATANKTNKVWGDLKAFIKEKKYPLSNGVPVQIVLAGIDSAFNPKRDSDIQENTVTMEHTVYEVVAAMSPKAIAVRGNDGMKDSILKEERIRKAIALKTRYELAVSTLKDELYTKLDMLPDSGIHMTTALSDDFFRGVLSEVYAETKPGKWEWKKVFERNEPLDCINLARGAAEYLNLPSMSSEGWKNLRDRLYR